MNNQLLGIIIVVICSLGYYFSWKYQAKDNFKSAVALLIICGLLLRIYCSMDFFLHDWDERYHALVAKNLMKHMLVPTLYNEPVLQNDFKVWTGSHIWLHKQPLPLWSMALSMMLFGVNEIALRIPSIIFTTAGIGLTFYLGSYFFNRKVGYLAAFLYSINGLIIEITSGRVATDHIDVFFLFFIELAVFFTILYVKKRNSVYNILVGISIGLAILSKWLPALIVLPIWFLIVFGSQNFDKRTITVQFVLILIMTMLVFLPWQLYIYNVFPVEAAWEAGFNYKHLTMVLEQQGGSVFYFLNKIRINYGDLIYLPMIWFLWKLYKQYDHKNFALVVWFLIPLLFFSFLKTKMQAYILFTSPALFLITADFFYWLVQNKKNYKYQWMITVLLILLIVLPVRYSIERIKPFENKERKPEWVSDLKKMNEKKIDRGVLFNYDEPIEAMFYTDLTAVYSDLPNKSLIEDLKRKGYTVIINDNAKVTDDIRAMDGIYFEHLTPRR